MFKKIGIGFVIFLLVLVLFLAGFLLIISLRDYKPEAIEPIMIANNQSRVIQVGEPFSVVTYNIGYAGLDKDTDFFMDGGTMSRARSKEAVQTNLVHILSFMKGADPDILLVQEIDVNSTRSYYVNQLEALQQELAGYSTVYAYNYKVDWVPVPLLQPMGKAQSVIGTFTKFQTEQSNRFSLPGQERWPTQLFELDRCFIESRISVTNDKELVLINLHLSAFDEGGFIRQQQATFLKEYIEKERDLGNYVIVGGDWNHVLPTTDPAIFPTTEAPPFWIQTFPLDFTPLGFTWVADKATPSVRTMETTYKKDENYLAVIDGFLVTQNISVQKVYGTNLNFEHTDHNPVTAQFILK